MTDLNDFVKEADRLSPFIKFEEGIPVVGKYQGAKVIPDNFNKNEQTVEYTLEINSILKTFNSKSVKLAKQLLKVKKGERVKLVRTGESFTTKWYVYTGDDIDKERGEEK